MTEPVDLRTEGYVNHPCVRCGTRKQILTMANGKRYIIATCFDTESATWWCTDCYSAEGAEERRAEMIERYQASLRQTSPMDQDAAL
jgi:hypothetical protein